MSEHRYEDLCKIAHAHSYPFCYSCYKRAVSTSKTGDRCLRCNSDDLMREMEGVGVEYGYEWLIKELLNSEDISPIREQDQEDIYEEMLNECYPEVDVCGYKHQPGYLLKEIDPIAFRCGMVDYFAEEPYIEAYGEIYNQDELDEWIDEQLEDLDNLYYLRREEERYVYPSIPEWLI